MTTDDAAQLAQELLHVAIQLRSLSFQAQAYQHIRPSEFRLLFTLLRADAKGMKVSEVSAQMQITPAAVTHIVNALEEAGHLERLAEPTDRRVVLVRLTEFGRQAVAEQKAHVLQTLSGLLDFLGEQDARELVRLFTVSLTYFRERSNYRNKEKQA
jgi:DNA-binding MarR family transcriptional regulator